MGNLLTLAESGMGMRKAFGMAVVAVLLMALASAPAAAQKKEGKAELKQAETKAGKAELKELTGFEAEQKGLKIEVGDKVKALCRCTINPSLFGKKVVEVYSNVTNTTDKEMHFGLYVAFFDKERKLVGCTSFGGDAVFARLRPKGFSTTTKTIELPLALLQRIDSYQVTLVADDKEFGKK
jgi:hypothetical protein